MYKAYSGPLAAVAALWKNARFGFLEAVLGFSMRVLAVVLGILLAGAFLPSAASAQQIEVQGANSQIITNGDMLPELAGGGGDGTDFGDVTTGSNAPGGSYFMVNRSLANDLNITSVIITGTNASDFTVLGSPGGSVIAANGGGGVTLALDIQFVPGANGLRGPATVTIVSDDAFGNSNFTFAIQGTGVGPDINIQSNGNPVVDGALLADTSVANGTDFGTRTSSTNANFFIGNTGTADLNLGNISLSGSSQFTITSDPSNDIINPSGGANVSATLQITFNPVGAGQQTATVTILNDDPDENPYTFVVEGVADAAQEIRVTGGTLSGEVFNGDGIPQTNTGNGTDFGAVALGSDLNTNFYIINDGIAGLLVTGSVTRISGSSAFAVTFQPATNSSIAYGFSETLQIRFTPPTGPNGSVHTAVFSIPNNDSDENPFIFTVSGTVSAPDMRVTGNGQWIVDGDPSPDPANDTDFGSQTVNTTASMTYTIFNDGDEDLSLSNVSVSGTNAGEFAVSTAPVSPVAPDGGSTTFTVNFTPGGTGTRWATIDIGNNDPGSNKNPYSFDVRGEGTAAPEIAFEYQGQAINDGDTGTSATNGTDFGSQTVGSTTDITYDIVNSGTAALTIGTLTFSGGNWNDYILVSAPPGPIAPNGGTGTITIRFTPGGTGSRPTNFSIVTNDADENPYNFNITGTGTITPAPEIDVFGNSESITGGDSSPSLGDHTDFGSADISGGLVTRTFTVENIGTDTLILGTTSLIGADAASFIITQPLSSSVAPLSNTTFTVQFDPTTIGTKTAEVEVPNNDADEGFFAFTIQGVGTTTAAVPDIRVTGNNQIITNGDFSPDTSDWTDFGSQTVGSSTDTDFLILNDGSGDLNIVGAVTISGSTDFTVFAQPASPITTGSSTLTIRFTPSGTGLRTAMVEIASDDPNDSPYEFSIQGNATAAPAPEIDVSGNSTNIVDGDTTPSTGDHTDFGSVDIVAGSVSRTFIITNNGTNTLDVISVSLSGSDAASFNVTQLPPSTITADGGATFVVEFDPSSAGTKTATLTILNSDADEGTFDFAIQGRGTSSAGGTITIVQEVVGPDTSVNFTSGTTALNFTLVTTGGSARSAAISAAAGTHTITAADLSAAGYGISAISCDDGDSSGNVDARTATIELASGENVTCTFETIASRDVTIEIIEDFLGARNIMLLLNQPDIARRLDRLNPQSQSQGNISVSTLGFTAQLPSPVDVQVSQNMMSYAASSQSVLGGEASEYPDIGSWDIWSEGSVALFDTNSGQTGTMGVVYGGVDYLLSGDALIGLRAQVDWLAHDFTATSGNVTGTGWMVGPYAMVRLDENFYFDVSATWGRSSNLISPFGTYVDEFSTTRWMINSSLVGEIKRDNWMVRPILSLLYIDEYQYAYTDSLNVAIPGQNVAQGELRFAPRVSYTNQLENGSVVVPWAEVAGVYTFSATSLTSTNSLPAAMSGFSGSIKAGVDFTTADGLFFNIFSQYDGIGSNAESYGLSLVLSAPLN